jgi:hypothetical protein
MKNSTRFTRMLILLLLITKSGTAQDYNVYQASEAVITQMSGDMHSESRLKKVIMALSNSSNQLSVRANIPYHSVNYIPEVNSGLPALILPFDLRMTINPWKIQDELTSTKVFITQAFVTMNNVTKAVKVEYIPLPAGTDQYGNFNVTMTIQFDGSDFNMGTPYSNSHFMIKISGAAVNMV